MKYLAAFLLLAGCADPQPPPLTITKIQVERVTIPAALQTCAADPAPGVWKLQSDVAHYILRLKAAGDDCRDTLAAAVTSTK